MAGNFFYALNKRFLYPKISLSKDSLSKDCPWMISSPWMISLIFRMQNYKKIDVRGYPQTRISLSKDDSLSKDCPWMICPWTISYFTHIFCPISVQGQSLDNFTYISYAKLQKNRYEGLSTNFYRQSIKFKIL